VFRGDTNESAVLCTDESTFEIKEAETSNSLLIMEKLSFPEEASRSSSSTSSSSSSSKSPDSMSSLPVISLELGMDDKLLEDDNIQEVLVRPVILHYLT